MSILLAMLFALWGAKFGALGAGIFAMIGYALGHVHERPE